LYQNKGNLAMPNRDLASIRKQYQRSELDWSNIASNPLSALQDWMNEAIHEQQQEPTAMVLATVDKNTQPHARVVLLKGLDTGLVFYTNYDSPKGNELANNNRAAATFFWPELERQVRVEGTISKVSDQQSDDYFASRPRDSQLAAYASRQGNVIGNRDELDNNFAQLTAQFDNKPIQRPNNWGGYRLTPSRFEFWQGRPNRLHDRLVFRLENDVWQRERLSP
jgi:pyridoxamine 5'-phosphate oxidase